jgi:ribosome biogenesis GTPase A
MVIVMTKCDLSFSNTVDAWKKYFKEKFNVTVVAVSSFTAFSGDADDADVTQLREQLPALRGSEAKYASASGVQEVINEVKRVIEEKREKDGKGEKDGARGKDDVITIGTVGNPNVGKSSFINALKGKPVVSVSRTPGHTKHFQTIMVDKGVMLCDCPGMVFPSLDRDRHLQVLNGLYPIAHLREPFSALRLLAESIPIEKIFKLERFREDPTEPWSPFTIGEAYAIKNKLVVGRVSHPDVQRGVREILNQILDGRVRLCWAPPKSQLINEGTTSEEEEKENSKDPIAEVSSKHESEENC